LDHRLRVVAAAVAGYSPNDHVTTMELLRVLSQSVVRDFDTARWWLLMTAVAGGMPTGDEFVRGRRLMELAAPGTEQYAVLAACSGMARDNELLDRAFRLSEASVVVDVDFTARHGYNTGIQRVVRETVSRWNGAHELELVAWTQQALTMRALDPAERARVVSWDSSRGSEITPVGDGDDTELVVPWSATVVLPEVAQARFSDRLACLTEFSGNRVALVGYDTIPISSAQYVVPMESDRFVRYLSVVKHSDVIAGISESSSREFRGFAAALVAQNLPEPRIETVRLPIDLPTTTERIQPDEVSLPLVLSVGTQEPRKNQLAVLSAAELLWREGLDFRLLFIGSGAKALSAPFDHELQRLQAGGRPVAVQRDASDAILAASYGAARFSVFLSLHEGYGLPMGESLASGTPVLAAKFGSMAEIATGGGCVLVDPRDDLAIRDAMRELLHDDALIERLRAQALARPKKTWDDYSRELWSVLIEPGDGSRRRPPSRAISRIRLR
jgi:glycosyltransferase involved in cell wall biosynthesis